MSLLNHPSLFIVIRLLVVFGLAVNSEITPEGMGHERNVVVFIHSATLLGIALGFCICRGRYATPVDWHYYPTISSLETVFRGPRGEVPSVSHDTHRPTVLL
jgi:hypothetical protein